MQVFLHHTIRNLLLAAMAFGATSCEWVKDDLPECPPTELRIGFKYDYHMFGGDVFYEHVGALYVYLFDRDDKFLSLYTETDSEVLGERGYEMVLNDSGTGPLPVGYRSFPKKLRRDVRMRRR
ncbi:FimB/Mfa2 family fimbrial subunit [Bacteroides fragilis]|nr:FimB/Mfa2 family fimbrial subunit [Bacteroides fragilis]